jgi:hypothetical protein
LFDRSVHDILILLCVVDFTIKSVGASGAVVGAGNVVAPASPEYPETSALTMNAFIW